MEGPRYKLSHPIVLRLGMQLSIHASEFEDKLYAVLENSWFTIKAHDINANWVKMAFGPEGLAEIAGTSFAQCCT